MTPAQEWVKHDETQSLIKAVREVISTLEDNFREGMYIREGAEETAIACARAQAMMEAYETVLQFVSDVEEEE